jgi:5-methylcytosine-specific restriction endonuclease McrA
MPHNIPDDVLEAIAKVTNKRARFVLDTIAEQGYVSTEEIRAAGYTHEPRAARDVRELGFPLKTGRTRHSNGRTIAIYTIPADGRMNPRKRGRQLLGKKQWRMLLSRSEEECAICRGTTDLQADHKVPYEVGGEPDDDSLTHFQILCGACNRKKSWSCESCPNWRRDKKVSTCLRCYWASPDNYVHIATQQLRRVDIEWAGNDVKNYDRLAKQAKAAGVELQAFLKARLSSGK